jgi:hypothetical protein
VDDLISLRDPPKNRVAKTDGDQERNFSEAAVMLAFVMHLIAEYPDIDSLEIHPDGEHGKRFDIRGWLEHHGYAMIQPQGTRG